MAKTETMDSSVATGAASGATTDAAEESASILDRLGRSPSEMKSEKEPSKGDSGDYAAITSEEMRGDPITKKVGFLVCTFKPLVRRDVRKFAELFASLPEIIQFAVAENTSVPGVNPSRIADLMTQFTQRVFEEAESERQAQALADGETFVPNPAPVPITPFDVTEALANANYTLDEMDEPLWKMVQLFTKETMPDLTQDTFIREVLDELDIHGYCDFVRTLKSALGGFRGSFADRFFRSGHP